MDKSQEVIEMLSKAATMLMGLIYQNPLNAYELTKKLQFMNVKQWYNIADSTVYATLKTLEKKALISGMTEKAGNMPDKTVYSLTDKGKTELLDTLTKSILQFNYDTNVFSVAAFFIDIFPLFESEKLLLKRLDMLGKYLQGVDEQIEKMEAMDVPKISIANVSRIREIINAELVGTQKLLEAIL